MGYTNDVCDAVALKAGGIAGMAGTSARAPETIPSSPWMVVGSHSAVYTPGNPRESIVYQFPLRLYVERLGDDADTLTTTNDLIELVIAAFAVNVTLAGGQNTTSCFIRSWDTNKWDTIGSAMYQATDFRLELSVSRPRTFTA